VASPRARNEDSERIFIKVAVKACDRSLGEYADVAQQLREQRPISLVFNIRCLQLLYRFCSFRWPPTPAHLLTYPRRLCPRGRRGLFLVPFLTRAQSARARFIASNSISGARLALAIPRAALIINVARLIDSLPFMQLVYAPTRRQLTNASLDYGTIMARA
jgi:hypothetical protein